jgi:hypothetical protein
MLNHGAGGGCEAGQLGEELPRRGAFFTLSASLGFSVGALGSDLAEKRTTRTSSLVGLVAFPFLEYSVWPGAAFHLK